MKYTTQDGFPYYIELIGDADYKQLYASYETIVLLESLNEEQANFRYAPEKWSIKQIIGHLADNERIMIYRALRFSKKDATTLPGYDQNVLVENSRFEELSLQQLITDFKNVRSATNSFIHSLSEAQLKRKGTASKQKVTVEEILKATIGHEIHHRSIIKNKYLKK